MAGARVWSDDPDLVAERLESLAQNVGVPVGERGTLADGRPVVWFRLAHPTGFGASVGMMVAGSSLRCTATQFTEDFASALGSHSWEQLNGPLSCARIYPSSSGRGLDVTVSAPVLDADAEPNVGELVFMLLEACALLAAGEAARLPDSFPTWEGLRGVAEPWMKAYGRPAPDAALAVSCSTPQNRPASLRIVSGPGTVSLVASSPNPELGSSFRGRPDAIARVNHMAPAGVAFWDAERARVSTALPLHPWVYDVGSRELDWAAGSTLELLDVCAYLGK